MNRYVKLLKKKKVSIVSRRVRTAILSSYSTDSQLRQQQQQAVTIITRAVICSCGYSISHRLSVIVGLFSELCPFIYSLTAELSWSSQVLVVCCQL